MSRVLLALATLLLTVRPAQASDSAPLRVVVLPKLMVDGKPQDEAGLAVAAERSYTTAGLRVVELAAALAAQRAAWADQLYAGTVPAELNVLSADAYVALRLACQLTNPDVMGSKIMAYGCALDARVIRVDSGDVVDSHASSWTSHGKSEHLAVRQALEGKAPELLSARLQTWKSKLTSGADWDLDLVAIGLDSRDQAQALADWTASISGGAARITSFRQGSARFVVHGTAQNGLAALYAKIERAAVLPLRITYQSERVLHVAYDLSRALRVPVVLVHQSRSTGTGELEGSDTGAELVYTALANARYLDVRELWGVGSKASDRALSPASLVTKAKQAGAVAALRSQLLQGESGYSQTLTLVDVATGSSVAAGSGEAATPISAVQAAVESFQASYRGALARDEARAHLGVPRGVAPSDAGGLLVRAFRLEPPALGPSALVLRGSLQLTNGTNAPIDGAEIRYVYRDKVLRISALPSLPAGGSANVDVDVALSPADLPEQAFAQLAASIRYPVGEGHAVVDAAAPWAIPVADAGKTRRRTALVADSVSRLPMTAR